MAAKKKVTESVIERDARHFYEIYVAFMKKGFTSEQAFELTAIAYRFRRR